MKGDAFMFVYAPCIIIQKDMSFNETFSSIIKLGGVLFFLWLISIGFFESLVNFIILNPYIMLIVIIIILLVISKIGR